MHALRPTEFTENGDMSAPNAIHKKCDDSGSLFPCDFKNTWIFLVV